MIQPACVAVDVAHPDLPTTEGRLMLSKLVRLTLRRSLELFITTKLWYMDQLYRRYVLANSSAQSRA